MRREQIYDTFFSSRAKASGMKLGKKGKDVETFVDKLVAEGESKCVIVWFLK